MLTRTPLCLSIGNDFYRRFHSGDGATQWQCRSELSTESLQRCSHGYASSSAKGGRLPCQPRGAHATHPVHLSQFSLSLFLSLSLSLSLIPLAWPNIGP